MSNSVVHQERTTNWAGNVVFSGPVQRPSSVSELQTLVAASPRLRALGTGHSFNRIADSTLLVSVGGLESRCELSTKDTVAVSAAMRFGELAPRIHAEGRALRNMGSLPHISVAGAAATGTHGSGRGNQSLSASVAAVELVTADGELRRYDRLDQDFGGVALALGALGVVTTVELDTVPTYELRQCVYDDIPFQAAADNLPAMLGAGYSVSLFTDWDVVSAWVKDAEARDEFFGYPPADGLRHPIRGVSAVHCTTQGGVPGPWFERLPHFRLDFTPSAGRELQTEYFVDAEVATEAMQAVHALRERVQPVLQVSEIRAIAADALWLSPAYGRDVVALHFTWVDDTEAVLPVVAAVEEALAEFEARPHWGKVFTMNPAQVRERYPRFGDFLALAGRLDPTGKFRNDFLQPYFSAS